MTPWYADPELAPLGTSIGIIVGLLIAVAILRLRGEL